MNVRLDIPMVNPISYTTFGFRYVISATTKGDSLDFVTTFRAAPQPHCRRTTRRLGSRAQHGVAGVSCLRPDFERGYARLHGARGEAGAEAASGEASGVDAGGGDALFDDERNGPTRKPLAARVRLPCNQLHEATSHTVIGPTTRVQSSSEMKSSSRRLNSIARLVRTPTPCSIIRSARFWPSSRMTRWGRCCTKSRACGRATFRASHVLRRALGSRCAAAATRRETPRGGAHTHQAERPLSRFDSRDEYGSIARSAGHRRYA
jgi:hypothetical protein